MMPLGCTITSNAVVEIGEIPKPLIELLPLNVGIHYTDEFQTYKITQVNSIPDLTIVVNVELGNANVAFFDYLFACTFENVTSLKSFPKDAENHNSIDLIVQPSVIDYEYFFSMSPATTRVSISYEIKTFLPNGNQIDSWIIKTDSEPEKGFYGLGHGKACEGVTKEALRDIATKYFVGFRDHIGITKKNCGNYNQ
jgi:hypothetical protein